MNHIKSQHTMSSSWLTFLQMTHVMIVICSIPYQHINIVEYDKIFALIRKPLNITLTILLTLRSWKRAKIISRLIWYQQEHTRNYIMRCQMNCKWNFDLCVCGWWFQCRPSWMSKLDAGLSKGDLVYVRGQVDWTCVSCQSMSDIYFGVKRVS